MLLKTPRIIYERRKKNSDTCSRSSANHKRHKRHKTKKSGKTAGLQASPLAICLNFPSVLLCLLCLLCLLWLTSLLVFYDLFRSSLIVLRSLSAFAAFGSSFRNVSSSSAASLCLPVCQYNPPR